MINKRSYFLLVLTSILILSLVFPGSALAAPDMIKWCPGLPPTGCTHSFNTFTGASGLINYLDNTIPAPSGAGTVYVSSAYSAASEIGDITFDAGTLDLTNLTIQGGWDFINGAVAGTSTIDGHGLIIKNSAGTGDWNGTVTLNDLNIPNTPSRAVYILANGNATFNHITVTNANNLSNTAAAVFVDSNADILANDIRVTNSTSLLSSFPSSYGNGAGLNSSGGSITLTNSAFDNNSGWGLKLYGNSGTTVDYVTATGNGRNGIEIGNALNIIAPITVTNSTFNGNGTVPPTPSNRGRGIYTFYGKVSISHVYASSNKGEGAYVEAASSVDIDDLTASTNGLLGAEVETASTSLAIRNSIFSGNGSGSDPASYLGAGLFVEATNGGALIAITASSNTGAGIYLNSSDQSVHVSGDPAEPLPLPVMGDGFVLSCSILSSNGYYGVVADLDDTPSNGQVDGLLQLFGVNFVPPNSLGDTLILSGASTTNAACGVFISGNAGAGSVTLGYTDGTPKTLMTLSGGYYLLAVSNNWSGTVTPSKSGVTFTPPSRDYSNITANLTAQDYTPTYHIYLPLVDR
jgi:hypothetical protein